MSVFVNLLLYIVLRIVNSFRVLDIIGNLHPLGQIEFLGLFSALLKLSFISDVELLLAIAAGQL